VQGEREGKLIGFWSCPMSDCTTRLHLEIPHTEIFDVSDRQQRREATRSFFKSVALKPTDGIYARFNKQVMARPFISLILRTPLTANAVTVIGFVFAIAGAISFAAGGYWPMLAGALLSYVSALFRSHRRRSGAFEASAVLVRLLAREHQR